MIATHELSDLIFIEDALDAMSRRQTREEFLSCFKPEKIPQAIEAWTTAQKLVTGHGTVSKALNAVYQKIEAQR